MAKGRIWITVAARLGLAAALLSTGTGCGAITALTNPKAAWALQEPAPMAVVLRRADAARATATNVDRLIGDTGVNASSQWIPKVALKKADVEKLLKDIGSDAEYAVPKGTKIRMIQAEAWAATLSTICPKETKFPNLLAAVSKEVAASYAEISGQAKTIAALKADRTVEETKLEDKDLSDADKEAHEKKKKEITEKIEKTEAEYRPKIDAFLPKLREEAGKAPAEVKAQMSVALLSFKRAVEDAKLANSVALMRYPLAMPNMPQELKTVAKRIVADVIEDKTGRRPTLENFDPDIKLEDGKVKVTLNGMPPEALMSLKPDVVIVDVVVRAKDYVAKVLLLAAFVAETQDLLELETEVIRNAMEGFAVEEDKVKNGGEDLGELKVELGEIAEENAGKGGVVAKGGKSGKASRHPVPMVACETPAAKAKREAAAATARAAAAEDDDDDDDDDEATDGGKEDKDDKDGKKKKHKGKGKGKSKEHKTKSAKSGASKGSSKSSSKSSGKRK